MREAIGGTYLYYIFIVFIIIIVGFLAVLLNYMSAYRASNHIITVLEQSEGVFPADLDKQLGESFSYYNDFSHCYVKTERGYVIRIVTFMKITIPLVDMSMRIPVKNETKTINCYGTDTASCVRNNSRNVSDMKECTEGW